MKSVKVFVFWPAIWAAAFILKEKKNTKTQLEAIMCQSLEALALLY